MRSTLHILVLVVPTFGGYSRRPVLTTAGLLAMSGTHWEEGVSPVECGVGVGNISTGYTARNTTS